MCNFKELKSVKTLSDVQIVITRTILSQNQQFNYQSIVMKIKDVLHKYNVEQAIIDSFKVERMIADTLDQLVKLNRLSTFNNIYIPKKMDFKRFSAAF